MPARLENRVRVFFQNFGPIAEIRRVFLARLRGDVEFRAQNDAADFSGQFLAGVAFIAKLPPEATRQTRGVSCPVRRLVQKRSVVGFLILESFKIGQADKVAAQRIERLVAAVADIRAGRGNEFLGARNPLLRVKPRGLRVVVMIGQAVDLLRVIDLVSVNVRNLPNDFFLAVLVFLFDRALGDMAGLGRRFEFFLGHMPAGGVSLQRGDVVRIGEAVLVGGSPERQDIDAGVGDAVDAQGAQDAGAVLLFPRQQPWADALLEHGDHLIGDVVGGSSFAG